MRSQGQRATVCQRRLEVLATGASSWGVCSFSLCGIVPNEALLLSVYMHTGAAFTQENWQILSTVGQWLASRALALHHRSDIQVAPKQLGGQWLGVRSQWLCGGAKARHRHTIASGHRLLRRHSRPCRRVRSDHADFGTHCTIVICTRLFQPRKLVMNSPKPLPTRRPSGCQRLVPGLGPGAQACPGPW